MTVFSLRRITARALLPWLAAAAFFTAPRPARSAERGFPLLTVYPAEVHKGGPQTFDVAQDTRGVLYFGNLHGLLIYDGAWWHMLRLPEDQVALSVAADRQGNVAVGMVNDFGVLSRDAAGAPKFQSLLPLLPSEKRQFGDVSGVCSTSAGFLFTSEQRLMLWNGRTMRIIAEPNPDVSPRSCYSDAKGTYLFGPVGMQQLDLSSMRISEPITQGRTGIGFRRADGRMIAFVRDKGLYSISGTHAEPFAPAPSAWLVGKHPTSGCLLQDGRMVFTTRSEGLVILSVNGEIEQTIEEGAGLPDAIITEARVDRDGSLWLAMEGPIVRIDLSSPVTVFDSRRGVKGAVSDVARFRDRLYISSSHGLYTMSEAAPAERVAAFPEGAWRMKKVGDELLVATTRGLFRTRDGVKFDRLVEWDGEVYDLVPSSADPQRVWLATRAGLASIRRSGDSWHYEGVIAGGVPYVSSVLEHDDIVWCGSVFNGVVRVEDARGARPRVKQFGTGEMNVFEAGGRAVFVRADGQIVTLGRDGSLIADPLLGHVRVPGGFFIVMEDPSGDVWINSTPPRVFRRNQDGSYAREGRPLVAVTAADIQTLRSTEDGVVWFASDKGLFRYDRSAARDTAAIQPPPLIRRVGSGETELLPRDAAATGEHVQLRHNFGRLRIEFAPVSFRPGVTYQYRLDPIDTGWSNWAEQPFIDYTTLEPNDYTFRLRARGSSMTPSEETIWSFVVLPPWYRTGWASALWLVLGAGLVLLIISVRTATLRRQAELLRARVTEKTAALQETVKLLEQANARLETLSLEDDLTGIANRRNFERALTEEWNRARRRSQPLALILIDLDFFKSLNDRRGHPAGDECLRRVGAFLSDTIRRSGEMVARYGGEEFAILLPGVDGEGAIRVAESLRDGIERLGIPYGNGNGNRVTGSCGVAAMTPGADMTAEHLVASADRALYAAKHSGRNCVRIADEGTTGTWLRDALA